MNRVELHNKKYKRSEELFWATVIAFNLLLWLLPMVPE